MGVFQSVKGVFANEAHVKSYEVMKRTCSSVLNETTSHPAVASCALFRRSSTANLITFLCIRRRFADVSGIVTLKCRLNLRLTVISFLHVPGVGQQTG